MAWIVLGAIYYFVYCVIGGMFNLPVDPHFTYAGLGALLFFGLGFLRILSQRGEDVLNAGGALFKWFKENL